MGTPRSFLLATLLALLAVSAHGAESRTDVRVLIDVSGSMKDNDPANLRVPALELLTGLMPAGARTGIWTFAEGVDRQVAPAEVDEAWKTKAHAAAGAIHSRGQRTDIEAALRTATADWGDAAPDTRRSVILLTDGMVDTGDAGSSAASRARILAERVAALTRSGGAVHAIALSAAADHDLLRALAVQTGGWYERADDAGQLERLFLRMFEKATEPDTVPIDGNRFTVDASIDEMTVLVFRAAEAPPMTLVDPEATEHAPGKPAAGFTWRTGNGYDMVTIATPARGEWRIDAEVDPDNRVMVVTDLRLEVGDLPSYVPPGTELPISSGLSEGGTHIDRSDFLRLVGMSALYRTAADDGDLVMLDDGEGGDVEAGDGLFGTALKTGAEEGVVELTVTADSGTFVREKRFSLEVVWPLAVRVEDGEPRSLVLTPRAEFVDPATLQPAVEWRANGAAEAVALVLESDADGAWRAVLDGADDGGAVTVRVRATTHDGAALDVVLPPVEVAAVAPPASPPAPVEVAPPAPAEPGAEAAVAVTEAPAEETAPVAEPPDWIRAGIYTAVVNVLLGGMVGGFLWWRRRRSRQLLLDFETALAPAA